jgi:hypothetical protein
VTISRAQDKVILFVPSDMSSLKTQDIRKDIFRFFASKRSLQLEPGARAGTRKVHLAGGTEEIHRLGGRMESKLVEHLKEGGFIVCRNGGVSWSDALLVTIPSGVGGALIYLENVGESEYSRKVILQQQNSLERAGRHCLRLSLAFLYPDFPSTLRSVLAFLKDAGMEIPKKTQGVHGPMEDGHASKTSVPEEVEVTQHGVEVQKDTDASETTTMKEVSLSSSSHSSETGNVPKKRKNADTTEHGEDTAVASKKSEAGIVNAPTKRKSANDGEESLSSKKPKEGTGSQSRILLSQVPFSEHKEHWLDEINAQDPSNELSGKPTGKKIREAFAAALKVPKGSPIYFVPLTKHFQEYANARSKTES